MEIWKEYKSDYFGSNLGRVKSFKNGNEKILRPAPDSDGYLTVAIYIGGKRKTVKVHRIVAELFIENPENKPQVNHKDGCKQNNFVENLEWTTPSENTRHSYANGLQITPQGEDHHNAKLTCEQVLYIRENPNGLNIYELAEKFNVVFQTISAIQLGRRYKNVGGQIRQVKKQNYLPEEKREKIRTLYQTGKYTRFQLSKMFDCSHGQIDTILRGK